MKQLKSNIYVVAAYALVASFALSCSSLNSRFTSAEDFLKDFNDDSDAVYEKYKDKEIFLKGQAVAPNKRDKDDIVLGLVGGTHPMEMILCYFEEDSPQARKVLLRVKDGEHIKVKCRSFGLPEPPPMVSLKSCQLEQ